MHSSQSGELRRALNETLTREEDDEDDEYTLENFLSDQIESRGRQKHISFLDLQELKRKNSRNIWNKEFSRKI